MIRITAHGAELIPAPTDEEWDAALAAMYRLHEDRRRRSPMSEHERKARLTTAHIEEMNTLTDGKNID